MRQKKFEKILYLQEHIATIIRSSYKVDNLEFFTSDIHPLQVGIHEKPNGAVLEPHIHLSNTKVITEIHEVLYIVYGKLKVTFYTIEGQTITSRILSTGDTVILMKLGHGFELLEDSKIFEVKQGPYPGTQHAKIFFDKKNSSK